jgi:hypothetical protein
MPMFVVPMADIVGSRRVQNRAELQIDLQRALDNLNESNRNLVSPYTITLGDEYQAVCTSAKGLFADALAVLAATYPHRLRFSFGVGQVDTPINPSLALGMDGPAFHLAREGIDKLKASGRSFLVSGLSLSQLELVNASLALVSHGMSRWNENRLSVCAALIRGRPVREIAEELDLSPQGVYQTIRVGALHATISVFEIIEDLVDLGLRENGQSPLAHRA